MNDNTYTNWYSMSDAALLQTIGKFVKHQRMEQNKTQNDLATAAGISRSTLSLLERGGVVTLLTLFQVLRVLNQLHVLEIFTVQKQISPLLLAEEDQRKRYRVRKKSTNKPNQSSSW